MNNQTKNQGELTQCGRVGERCYHDEIKLTKESSSGSNSTSTVSNNQLNNQIIAKLENCNPDGVFQRRAVALSITGEVIERDFVISGNEEYEDLHAYFSAKYPQEEMMDMSVDELQEKLNESEMEYNIWVADKEARAAIKSAPVSEAQMVTRQEDTFVQGLQGGISAGSDLILQGFGLIVDNEIKLISQGVKMLLCGLQSNCICEKCFFLVTEALIYPSNIALIWNRVLDHHVVVGRDGSRTEIKTTRIESAQFLLLVVLGEFLRHNFNAVGVRESLLALLPKTFAFTITRFFPSAVPYEAEAQSNYIWEGLCSIIKTWNPMTTISREDFHEAATFAKDMSSIQSFTQRTILFVTDLAMRLIKVMAGATLNVDPEVAGWIQRVEDLGLEPLTFEKMGEPDGVFLSLPKRMATWPRLREDVYNLYKEGSSLYHKYALIDVKSAEAGLLSKYKAELKKVIAENTSSYLGSEGKNKPVFIVLHGDPGQGKTVCVDHLMRDLCAERGEAKYNPSLDKYSYNSVSEYFEGYNYQKVFEVSDFMQIREKESRVNELMNILHCADESAYCLNIAFEKKGTIYFHSKYVMLTTNLDPHVRVNAIRECIEFPDAFYRRINIMAKVENDVTTGKFNKDSMKFIVSQNPRDSGARTTVMNWNEFVAHISNVTDQVNQHSINVRDLDDAYSDDRILQIRKLKEQVPTFDGAPTGQVDEFELKATCIGNEDGKCPGCAKFVATHKGFVTGEWKLKVDHSGTISRTGHQCGQQCKYAIAQSIENVLLFDMGNAQKILKKLFDGISLTEYDNLLEKKIFDEIARELSIPVFTDDDQSYFPKNIRYKGYLSVSVKRVKDDNGDEVMKVNCEYKWYNLNYIAAFLENAGRKASNFRDMAVEMIDAVVMSRMGSIWQYLTPNKVKTKIRNLVMKSGMDKVVEFFQNVVLPALLALLGIIGAIKLWSWVFKETPSEVDFYGDEEMLASDNQKQGHRPRLPAKRKMKSRALFKADAQMLQTFGGKQVVASQMVANAMEMAIHNIKPNIGLVSTVAGTTNAVALREKFILVPEHVIPEQGEDQITMSFPGGKSFSFSYSEVSAVYSTANHFIVIDLSSLPKFNRMPSFASIIRYMNKVPCKEAPDGFLFVAGQSGTSLCTIMKLATNIEGPARTNVRTADRRFEVPECYKYSCPTQSGDCGAPLLTVIDSQPVLLGFHIAMYLPDRVAFAGAVSKDWWEEVISPRMGAQAQVKPVVTDFPSAVTYLEGPVPYTFQPRVSKLVRSDLWTEDCMFKPAPLKGWFDEKQPLQRAFEKSLRPIVSPDESEFYDAVQELKEIYDRPDHYPKEMLTVEEAIFGVNDIPGMASTGGVGYPWSEKYTREALFSYEVSSISSELYDKCLENMHQLRRGERLDYVIVDMAKDEKLPVAKADQGKCRLFFILPIDINITCKQVFGRFSQFIINLHTVGPIKVGHASEAVEVRKMAHYLCLDRNDLKYLTPDTAASDRSIPYAIFMQVVEVANFWYDDDNDRLRGVLAASIFCCVHILDGIKYEMRAGMPSGFYLTSVFNSLAYFIAYHSCLRQLRVCIVSIATFGDDVVIAVDKREKVKEEQIIAKCKDYGLDITGVKKDEPLKFCGPAEVVFLQRTFEKRGGMWYSPMDLQRIQHQMMWYKRTKETKTWSKARIHEEILRNAFHEFYQHGRQVFNQMEVKYKPIIDFYGLNIGNFEHHHDCYVGGVKRHLVFGDEISPTFGCHDDYFSEAQMKPTKSECLVKEYKEGTKIFDNKDEKFMDFLNSEFAKYEAEEADLIEEVTASHVTEIVEIDDDKDNITKADASVPEKTEKVSKPIKIFDKEKGVAQTVNITESKMRKGETAEQWLKRKKPKDVQRIEMLNTCLAVLTDPTATDVRRSCVAKCFLMSPTFADFVKRDGKTELSQITKEYLLSLRDELTQIVKDRKPETWWEWIKRKCLELWQFIKRKFSEFMIWANGTFTAKDCRLAGRFKELKKLIDEFKEDEDNASELAVLLEEVDTLRLAAIVRATELKKSLVDDVDGSKQTWYEWIATQLKRFATTLTMRRTALKEESLVIKLTEATVTKKTASDVIINIADLEQACRTLEERSKWTTTSHVLHIAKKAVVGTVVLVGTCCGVEYLFPGSFATFPILRLVVPTAISGITDSTASCASSLGLRGDFFVNVDEFAKKFSGVSICNFVLGGLGFLVYENFLFLLNYGVTCNRWVALNPASTVIAPLLEELGFEHPAHKAVFGVCEFLFYVAQGINPVMRLPALACHLALAYCAHKDMSVSKRVALHSAFNIIAGQCEVSMRTQEQKEEVKSRMIDHYKRNGTQQQLDYVTNAGAGLFSNIKDHMSWKSLGVGLLFAFGITGVTYMVKDAEEGEEKRILESTAQMDAGLAAQTNIGEVEENVSDVNLTQFVEMTPSENGCVPSSEYPIMDSGFEWEKSYCKELERLVKIADFALDDAPKATPHRFNGVVHILNEKYIANRFFQAVGARFDIEYQIRVVVTKFHYGQIMALVRPALYQNQGNIVGVNVVKDFKVELFQDDWGGYDSVYTASQCEHVVIPLTHGPPVTLCSKWHYPFNWVYCMTPAYDALKSGTVPAARFTNLLKFGVLDIYNLTGAHPVGMTDPRVCVWARFKNLRLFGFNSHIPTIMYTQIGYPAAVAIGQAGEAEELADDSWSSTINGITDTVSGFVKTFTSVLAFFGMSNPRREGGPRPMVNMQYPTATSYGDSPAVSLSYRLDDKQPSLLDEKGKNELLLSTLAAKPTYFGCQFLTNTDREFAFLVSMAEAHVFGNGHVISPAAFIKRFFKLARADIKVKFHFSASAVVNTRVWITAIPRGLGVWGTSNTPYKVSASPDISGDVVYEMNLPYMEESQYMENGPVWFITCSLTTDIISTDDTEVKPIPVTIWYSFPNAEFAVASVPQVDDHSTYLSYLPIYQARAPGRVLRSTKSVVETGPFGYEGKMINSGDSFAQSLPKTGVTVHPSNHGLACSPTSILHVMKRFSTVTGIPDKPCSLRPMRPIYGTVNTGTADKPYNVNYVTGGAFHMFLLMFKYVHGGTNLIHTTKSKKDIGVVLSEASFNAGDASATPIADISHNMISAGGYMFDEGDVKMMAHVPYRARAPYSFVETPIFGKDNFTSQKKEWMFKASVAQYPVLVEAGYWGVSASDDLEPFLFIGVPALKVTNVT